jgi:hypothetical protein
MNTTHTRSRLRQLPLIAAAAFALLLLTASPSVAQGWGGGQQSTDTTGAGGAPDVAALIAAGADDSDLRVVVRRFEQDRAVLTRRYDFPLSPVRMDRQRVFLNGWSARLDELDRAGLNAAGQEDYEMLREEIRAGLAELDENETLLAELQVLVPFGRPIQQLQERRRDRLDVESFESAQAIEDARKEVLALTQALVEGDDVAFANVTPELATAALEHLASLQSVLNNWYNYYYAFDPLFTWWVQTPYAEFTEALEAYSEAIGEAWSVSIED